jgi:hypothetical protein
MIQVERYYNHLPWHPEPTRHDGETCQACGRFLKVYYRKLSTAMALALVRLFGMAIEIPNRSYFHVREFYKERGDFAKLKFWGMIEEAPNEDETKKSSGLWRITDEGTKFVCMETKVPQYVILKWGSELLGFAGAEVDVRQCLEFGNKFNYSELMGSLVKENP